MLYPLQDMTNKLLPYVTDPKPEPRLTFLTGEPVPQCCLNSTQNIHPILGRYLDVPSGNGFMSYSKLTDILNEQERTLNFLGSIGVLAPFQTCPKCGKSMKRTWNAKHKWHWVCNRRQGKTACKVNFSVRRGTYFTNKNLSFKMMILIIWHFVHRIS